MATFQFVVLLTVEDSSDEFTELEIDEAVNLLNVRSAIYNGEHEEGRSYNITVRPLSEHIAC